tara:strand:+ start:452 stop:637 length:186 start_codon:yes stop_codon:yes gene_type:complete
MVFPLIYENGGGGGSRTRVQNKSKFKSFTSLEHLLSQMFKDSQKIQPTLTDLLRPTHLSHI